MRLVLTLLLLALCTSICSATQPSLSVAEVPEPQITVFLFHQVSNSPIVSRAGEDRMKRPWLSPAQFEAFIASLEHRGYQPVTLKQTLDFVSRSGSALPAKPYLVTFDDGFRSALVQATPILRRHSIHAVMFFEGVRTGDRLVPGRLSQSDLLAMKRSGTWDLQCHGWAGHSDITIDSHGTSTPYWYANLMWLPHEHRLETPAEFETRIRVDLHHFKAAFEPLLKTPIDVFAYPSGEFGQTFPAHSNASGLTARLTSALQAEGFRAAFAVALAESNHPVSLEDSVFALPRVGIGEKFAPGDFADLRVPGIELPAYARGRIADPGPLVVYRDRIFVAAHEQPVIYELDLHGTLLHTHVLEELQSDRANNPALIAGLALSGDTLEVVQNAGTWRGGTAYRSDIALGSSLRVIKRRALDESMAWLVGSVFFDSRLYGLTDDGRLYDVDSATQVGALEDSPTPQYDRFTGLAATHSGFLTYDKIGKALIAFERSGKRIAVAALDAPLHDLFAADEMLYASNWEPERRSMRRFRLTLKGAE